MKFTEAGKALFEKYLKENHLDIVAISIEESEDQGAAINVNLITEKEGEGKRVIDVDGIKVAISEEDEAGLEKAVIDRARNPEAPTAQEAPGTQQPLVDVGRPKREFVIDLPHHEEGCCCSDGDCGCGCDEAEGGCCGEHSCGCEKYQ